MPKWSVEGTVLALLFEHVPRKYRFVIFGEERVPVPTVAAAQIVLTSIGLAAGLRWPERVQALFRVQPGFRVEEVIGNVCRRLESELASTKSISPALQIWVAAYVEDWMFNRAGWYPFKAFEASGTGPYAYATGASAGIARDDAETILKSWLSGIANSWANALEAGLAIDGSSPSYESLISSVDDLLTLVEAESAAAEPPESWQAIEYLWRFECYRIALFAIGSSNWRDPEIPKYRGILY